MFSSKPAVKEPLITIKKGCFNE